MQSQVKSGSVRRESVTRKLHFTFLIEKTSQNANHTAHKCAYAFMYMHMYACMCSIYIFCMYLCMCSNNNNVVIIINAIIIIIIWSIYIR